MIISIAINLMAATKFPLPKYSPLAFYAFSPFLANAPATRSLLNKKNLLCISHDWEENRECVERAPFRSDTGWCSGERAFADIIICETLFSMHHHEFSRELRKHWHGHFDACEKWNWRRANKGIFGFGSLSDCALPAQRTHLLEVFDFCSLRVSSPTAPCLCICRHASPDVCVIYACVCVGDARNSGGLLSRSLFGGLTHARVRF